MGGETRPIQLPEERARKEFVSSSGDHPGRKKREERTEAGERGEEREEGRRGSVGRKKESGIIERKWEEQPVARGWNVL